MSTRACHLWEEAFHRRLGISAVQSSYQGLPAFLSPSETPELSGLFSGSLVAVFEGNIYLASQSRIKLCLPVWQLNAESQVQPKGWNREDGELRYSASGVL